MMRTKKNVTAMQYTTPAAGKSSRRVARGTVAERLGPGGLNTELVAEKLPRQGRSAIEETIPRRSSPTATSSQSGASRSQPAGAGALPTTAPPAGNSSGANRSRSADLKPLPFAMAPTGTHSESGSNAGAGEAGKPPLSEIESPRRPKSPRKGKGAVGQARPDTREAPADSAQMNGEGEGLSACDALQKPADSLPTQSDGLRATDTLSNGAIAGREVHYLPVIFKIQDLAMHRWQLQRAKVALILQGNAVCRGWLAKNGEIKSKNPKAAKSAASALFDKSYKDYKKGIVRIDKHLAVQLEPFWQTIPTFERKIAAVERTLKGLVAQLPIQSWVKGIPGFGEINLANLVGAAQDIGSFKTPSALWKRMGLAVISGERQRRYKDKEMALLHGYSPQRRALAFNLGEAMIKKKNRYRSVYDERKAYEMPRCEAIAVEKKAQGVKRSADGKIIKYSPKSHAHKRSMRYMVKRVLRDLYNEWRRLDRGEVSERNPA